jgi:hypothetical protein
MEEDDTRVVLCLNDPAYLRERHGIPPELLPDIAGAGTLLRKAVEGEPHGPALGLD